jgi:hypothetical protein
MRPTTSTSVTNCLYKNCRLIRKQDVRTTPPGTAVSLSVATEEASLPVAYRLYVPQEWADHPTRRQQAGVPNES